MSDSEELHVSQSQPVIDPREIENVRRSVWHELEYSLAEGFVGRPLYAAEALGTYDEYASQLEEGERLMFWAASLDITSAAPIDSADQLIPTVRMFAWNAVGGFSAVPDALLDDVRELRGVWSSFESANGFFKEAEANRALEQASTLPLTD